MDLVLKQNNDSILQGVALQETGIYFYWTNQLDSAQYYLRKSLKYPFRNNNYAIRCFILSDLFFDLEQFDSSFIYATKALRYPANSFTNRECYRILTNIAYTRKDLKQMGNYMIHYQDCTNDVQ